MVDLVIKVVAWVSLAYALTVAAVFVFHLIWLPMVTPGLAAARSAVWPIYRATGWPKGQPLSPPFEGDDQ